jgi:hypothetical protein
MRERTAGVVDSPDQPSPNRGTVPTTEVRGQDHTTPRHHLHQGCGRQATHSETTSRQPSTKPNGSAQPRPPNAATPSASGGWSKATRSETTPRHPSATGVDKGLHGTKTHKHCLQASTADQNKDMAAPRGQSLATECTPLSRSIKFQCDALKREERRQRRRRH